MNALKVFIEETFALNFPIVVKDIESHTELMNYQIDYDAEVRELTTRISKSYYIINSENASIINCSQYSDGIEGRILIKNNDLTYDLEYLPPERTYLFDFQSKKLVQISDPSVIEDGIYHVLPYAYMSDAELQEIRKKGSSLLYMLILFMMAENEFIFYGKIKTYIF